MRRQHVFLVCAICSTSDALLISAGVFGFGNLTEVWPFLGKLILYLGIIFLTLYGFFSFKSALQGVNISKKNSTDIHGAWHASGYALALTFLNPHVYLDTVFLIGAVATQFETGRFYFGLGAITSSFVFFFCLGYGARLVSRFFEAPYVWRYIDFFVGVVMWTLAIKLLIGS